MSRNKKVDRLLIFSNFTKSDNIELLISFLLSQNISILVENALFIRIILITLLSLTLFLLVIFSFRDFSSPIFILLRLDWEINLRQEDFEIDRQTSKLSILILDKTFRIICMHYLFALCELLKKITNLTILKRDLYKYKRKILSSK